MRHVKKGKRFIAISENAVLYRWKAARLELHLIARMRESAIEVSEIKN